jgi:hypothetical protein
MELEIFNVILNIILAVLTLLAILTALFKENLTSKIDIRFSYGIGICKTADKSGIIPQKNICGYEFSIVNKGFVPLYIIKVEYSFGKSKEKLLLCDEPFLINSMDLRINVIDHRRIFTNSIGQEEKDIIIYFITAQKTYKINTKTSIKEMKKITNFALEAEIKFRADKSQENFDKLYKTMNFYFQEQDILPDYFNRGFDIDKENNINKDS